MTIADYFRALAKTGEDPDGANIPRLVTDLGVVKASWHRAWAMRSLLREEKGASLPLIWPHIIAFEGHLHNMVDARFPLKPMGVVHVRNRLRQLRPLRADETLRYVSSVEGQRATERGLEFDLVAEVFSAELELVWKSWSTMLVRKRRAKCKPSSEERPPLIDSAAKTSEYWDVSRSLARRYAFVSGDLNPIHLGALTARLFGFAKPLAHGMWSLGRLAARASREMIKDPLELHCDFKLPVLLPARLKAEWWSDDRGVAIRLMDERGVEPHLVGHIAPIPKGEGV